MQLIAKSLSLAKIKSLFFRRHAKDKPGKRTLQVQLPQELLDIIVDFAHDSRQDLATLCLTSRRFYGRASRHLFRNITVTTPSSSFGAFVGFLESLGVEKRRRTEHLALSRHGIYPSTDGRPVEVVTAGLVASLLPLLPDLRSLTLHLVTIAPDTRSDTPRHTHSLDELSFLQTESSQLWCYDAHLQILSLFHELDTLAVVDRAHWYWPVPDPLDAELLEEPYFPRALAVKHLRTGDVRDSMWLPLLARTRTLCDTPTLRTLDLMLAPHGTGALRGDMLAALRTAGVGLAVLRYRLWPEFWPYDSWPDPYAHVAQLPHVATLCPRLQTFVVGVPLWCSLPYVRMLFLCVAGLLAQLSRTVRTFVFELDFEGHVVPAAALVRNRVLVEWEPLKLAVERAGVTHVHIVWRYLEAQEGSDWRQELLRTECVVADALESPQYMVVSNIEAYGSVLNPASSACCGAG